jgi:hypothetical protein
MSFAFASGVITQTGTDANLSGLVGLAGVTTTLTAGGVTSYSVDSAITLIVINGDLTHNPDNEVLICSDSTRVEVTGVYRYGLATTVNGKTRLPVGCGLILNRRFIGGNTSTANMWFKNGSSFITRGGEIKTRAALFFGTTTNPSGQVVTIDSEALRLVNTSDAITQVWRLFVDPVSVSIRKCFLSATSSSSTPFSSLGFGEISVIMDFGSFQCDGNGAKAAVEVRDAAFEYNKALFDYLALTSGNSLSAINKYIFQNPDTGSGMRPAVQTLGASGVIEINRDLSFNIADAGGAPIQGAAIYSRFLGASLNPISGSRFAGVDDYVTPRTFVAATSSGEATGSVLYAVAQRYQSTVAFQPMIMDSLTTQAGDVQTVYYWAYAFNGAQQSVPLRGNGTAGIIWTLFADPSITLNETAARAKLASSFTVNATTKFVTVTANSSYEDLYDALKAYKSTANLVNLEATPIDQLLVTPNGARLTGYTGWTLVVNSGVTLTAGGKYTSLYFDTVTVSGAIDGTYADSTGTRVALTNRNGVVMTSYVLINGTPVGGATVDGSFIPGFVPLVMSRTLTVLPADTIRMVVNAYGYKPQVINCTGADLNAFTVTLELETGVDTTVSTVIRDAVAAAFGFIQASPTQIDITVNQTLAAYFPKDVVAGIAYAVVTKGHLIFASIAQTNNANVYSLGNGQLISYFPGFKLRMNDTAVGGAAIVPTAAGYSIPLVSYYFDQATGTASPVTILNASNAKIETAPWTQATATISEQDKQAIADSSAVEVWTAPTRTLTSGGGGGATAQEVWEYVDRTLTAGVPTAAQNASAVRTELATELSRVDVATSTRLAETGYTAPDNAGITAIKAKTDTLVNGPTLAQIEGSTILAKEATLADKASQASVTALGTPMQAGEVVDANIVKVNDVFIDGVGTQADPFGPV